MLEDVDQADPAAVPVPQDQPDVCGQESPGMAEATPMREAAARVKTECMLILDKILLRFDNAWYYASASARSEKELTTLVKKQVSSPKRS